MRTRLTHHARVVVVVVVASGAERAVGALLGLEAAHGAERSAVQVVADVGLAARLAAEALEARLQGGGHVTYTARCLGIQIIAQAVQGGPSGRGKPPVDLVPALPAAGGPLL